MFNYWCNRNLFNIYSSLLNYKENPGFIWGSEVSSQKKDNPKKKNLRFRVFLTASGGQSDTVLTEEI